MIMLRWILGISLKDHKRNEDIRRAVGAVGVASITHKVREARLRWYGHVRRREEHASIRRIMEAEVHGHHRHHSRRRQRKRWIYVVNEDLKELKVGDVTRKTDINEERGPMWLTPHRIDYHLPEGDREIWRPNGVE